MTPFLNYINLTFFYLIYFYLFIFFIHLLSSTLFCTGIPIWVGRKLHARYSMSNPHRRNLAVVGGVTASVSGGGSGGGGD